MTLIIMHYEIWFLLTNTGNNFSTHSSSVCYSQSVHSTATVFRIDGRPFDKIKLFAPAFASFRSDFIFFFWKPLSLVSFKSIDFSDSICDAMQSDPFFRLHISIFGYTFAFLWHIRTIGVEDDSFAAPAHMSPDIQTNARNCSHSLQLDDNCSEANSNGSFISHWAHKFHKCHNMLCSVPAESDSIQNETRSVVIGNVLSVQPILNSTYSKTLNSLSSMSTLPISNCELCANVYGLWVLFFALSKTILRLIEDLYSAWMDVVVVFFPLYFVRLLLVHSFIWNCCLCFVPLNYSPCKIKCNGHRIIDVCCYVVLFVAACAATTFGWESGREKTNKRYTESKDEKLTRNQWECFMQHILYDSEDEDAAATQTTKETTSTNNACGVHILRISRSQYT